MGCLIFFTIIFVVVFIVGAFGAGEYLICTIGVLIVAAIIILKLIVAKNKREKREADKIEAEKLLQLKKRDYNAKYVKITGMFGEPTKRVAVEQYNLDREIVVFEEDDRIWICGRIYSLTSILGCTLENNHSIIRSDVISTTKTDTESMLVRSVIGSAVAGDAGAIVGGATASKTTISKGGIDKIGNNYTVVIYVDSLSDPIISIDTGDDSKKTNEIMGLMNVIINRNSKRGWMDLKFR